MKLNYTMQGDYLLPELEVPQMPSIGKYGMMRRSFLKEHRDGIYTGMLLSGKLNSHLQEVDRSAREMMENLTGELAKKAGITENLKAQDQMKWVRMMNSVKNQAEEIVLSELIYS